MMRAFGGFGLAACLLAATIGCGGSGTAETVETGGVVTYKGQPLSNVNVIFTPVEGRPAFGTTDDQGRFTLTTFSPEDGAVPGQHTVTVTSAEVEPMPGTPEAAAAGPRTPRFPARYSDPKTSNLTANVEDANSDLKFDLTD